MAENKLFLKGMLVVTVIIPIVALLLTSCSSMESTTSSWTSKKIVPGVKDNDWGSMTLYEDKNVMVGFRNDKDNLYFCLKSGDPATQRKIMMLGLTVWLNTSDNKTKSLGIHYPVGAFRNGMPPRNQQDPQGGDNKLGDETMSRRMTTELNDFEFVTETNEGKKVKLIPYDEAKTKYGVSVSINTENEVLTYELSVPLNFQSPDATFSADFKKPVGLGFETGQFKRPENGGEQRNEGGGGYGGGGYGGRGGYGGGGGFGGRGGGMGGGMGGRHGGMGGRSGGNSEERQKMFEPLEMWFSVNLSNNK